MSDDLHHLAAPYALDALDPAERAAFEAHYPTCDVCTAEVDGFKEAATALAEAVATKPPATLRGSVLGGIARTRQEAPLMGVGHHGSEHGELAIDQLAVRRRRRLKQAALGAAAALVVLAGAVGVIASRGPDEFTEVVEAADRRFVSLEGESGDIQAYWSPSRDQVALASTSIEPVPEGQTYALWFLLDGGVQFAGAFTPDDNGMITTVLDVDDIEGNGWGVTLEPEAVPDQPSGEVIFIGEF